MTDNEIIKFMQCVMGNDANCSECAYQKTLPFPSCRRTCAKDALDLINRQKAEIEGLEETRYELACIIDELLMCMADGKETKSAKPIDINEIKSGAIKEFADRLCDGRVSNDPVVIAVKVELEMTEVEINQRKEDEGK